jgi:hypothetical protein
LLSVSLIYPPGLIQGPEYTSLKVTAHMYVNAKMIPTPRMGEGGDKEEW